VQNGSVRKRPVDRKSTARLELAAGSEPDFGNQRNNVALAYRKRCEALCSALRQFVPDEIDYVMPEGGMFVWARGPADQAVRGVRSWMVLAGVLVIVIGLHPTRFASIFRPEISNDGVRALRAFFLLFRVASGETAPGSRIHSRW